MSTDNQTLTEEDARAERSKTEEWVQNFQIMQQQAPAVLQRLAYLNGFLEGRSTDA